MERKAEPPVWRRSERMVRASMPRAVSGFERLLLFFGFLLLLLFIAFRVFDVIYSRAALRAFWQPQSFSLRAPTDAPHRNAAIPDFRFWSQQRIEAYQASLIGPVQRPLGVLKIPAIDLEVPVLEGTDDLTLNRAVGHIDGTPIPAHGETGNIGIAGHRDGFFRGLRDIHLGDVMDLLVEQRNSRYVVDEIVIVPPDDVSVLAARSKPSLTLVTCYPFYFVGSAPLRYVVRASIADSSSFADSGRSRSLAEERGADNSH
jgi:sortase A